MMISTDPNYEDWQKLRSLESRLRNLQWEVDVVKRRINYRTRRLTIQGGTGEMRIRYEQQPN